MQDSATKKRTSDKSSVRERLYWCYANLAMAHAAIKQDPGLKSYGRLHFMIRAKLYKGLMDGSMKIGSILDDEREKMKAAAACSFCGSADQLSVDHLLPRQRGGIDDAENLILACRSCNSSKGARDLLEWYGQKDVFPPLLLLRRYLKVSFEWCRRSGKLEDEAVVSEGCNAPFRFDLLPQKFPPPAELRLTVSNTLI